MPKDDHERYRPDVQGRARRGFEAASSPSAQAKSEISLRAARARERLQGHQQKMGAKFVAAETKRLHRQSPAQVRSALADGPRPPALGPSKQAARQDALQARAEANVRKRYELKLRAIDKAEHRMLRKLQHKRTQQR